MKKVVITVVVIIALLAAWIMSNGRPDEAAEPEQGTETAQAVWVETTPAVMQDIETFITETGSTIPTQFAVVSSEVSGKIIKMDKDVGDFINVNETIASIDDELATLAVDQANAQLINTRATFEKAKKDLDRYKILLDQAEVSEGEYENIKLQYELANSANLNAEASLKSALRQLRNTKIKNSFSGQVAERHVQEGDMVSIGTPIVKIVDISAVKVKINISEKDVVKLGSKAEAAVEIDAFPGRSFKGRIHSVSPEGRMDTHTFPVEIIVPNTPDHILKSGMVARVLIRSDVLEDAVVIPAIAVIERYGRYYVYVAGDGTAEEKQVTLGVEKGTEVQILSGVEPGDKIITAGQHSLENGTEIKVK